MSEMCRTRLVSGEIMARAVHSPRAAVAGHDVVDAEFETVGDPRSAAPTPRPTPEAAASPVAGLGTLRGDTPQPPKARWQRGGATFWMGGIAIASAAFWVSGGHALFGLASAGPAKTPPSPLRIVDVASRVETSAARAVLLVDGEALNEGTTRQSLPPLVIEVTSDDGSRTSYRLGTSGRFLQEGERFAFSGRFEVPKEGVKTVSVTFAE
jgi:hypothetical protein